MCLRLKQLEDRFIFEKWNILPERFKLQKQTGEQDSEQLEIMLEYVFDEVLKGNLLPSPCVCEIPMRPWPSLVSDP